MDARQHEIHQRFGHQLRLRVSGICLKGDSILLVKHTALGKDNFLWTPPGGGLSFEETVHEALKREFIEETGLTIETKELLFVNEYFEHPLHAIELFFKVEITGGELMTGIDPEMTPNLQIIQEVRFVPFAEIINSKLSQFHSLFATYQNADSFQQKGGFYQNILQRTSS
jgi:8-oxo-dGTP diphosphatase